MKLVRWVRLKVREREGWQTAFILHEAPDLAKGAVYLSRGLGRDGLRWWNKQDLVRCAPPASAINCTHVPRRPR